MRKNIGRKGSAIIALVVALAALAASSTASAAGRHAPHGGVGVYASWGEAE